MAKNVLQALGGEEGCRRLANQFYGLVAGDPVLKPLFPGKSLRCATEQFAAFLIQFLEGDEAQTQERWALSLRESHRRFAIGPAERAAWLRLMKEALGRCEITDVDRARLHQFFVAASGNLTAQPQQGVIADAELAERWSEQQALDALMEAIAAGREDEALALAPRFARRPSVFLGVLGRLMQSGQAALVQFCVDSVERSPTLTAHRHAGRTLLHYAAAAGCAPMVALLLRLGMDPNAAGQGGHPPLYRLANECSSAAGPMIAGLLVAAGARVNHQSGVTRATALHMAARRGYAGIARELLALGADRTLRDRKGATPLQRAIQCKQLAVAELLRS